MLNPSPEKATLPDSEAPKGSKQKVQHKKEAENISPEVFVSMTFKLPQEIPADLLRASADRKIEKFVPEFSKGLRWNPFSQWLKKNGYL